MLRTFNYTNRARIDRRSVSIQLHGSPSAIQTFDVELHLEDLRLPDDAAVYVEAFQGVSYMRFAFGTVANRVTPPDRRLIDLDRSALAYFRVKIVDEAHSVGRLLADADRITPTPDGDSDSARDSILHRRLMDLGDEVWKIAYEDNGPYLLLNQSIPNIAYIAERHDGRFFASVYPQVVRDVLTEAIVEHGAAPDDDSDDWWSIWLQFARRFNSAAPEWSSEPADDEIKLEWIEKAVAGFCRQYAASRRFSVEYIGGGA